MSLLEVFPNLVKSYPPMTSEDVNKAFLMITETLTHLLEEVEGLKSQLATLEYIVEGNG